MKKIVFSIGILLISVFLLIFLKKNTLVDYFRLQEAGQQSVVAVEMWTESIFPEKQRQNRNGYGSRWEIFLQLYLDLRDFYVMESLPS